MNFPYHMHIGDLGNVEWTVTKYDFLGLGGSLSKVLLIKMCIFAKNCNFHLYFKTHCAVSICLFLRMAL